MATIVSNPNLVQKITDAGEIIEQADSASERTIYPVSAVLFAGETKFVRELLILKNKTQGIFLCTDSELQSATSDEAIYHEHLIHPTVLLHKHFSSGTQSVRVLVLGAGEGATIRELLKYETVTKVVWNDIDEGLVDLCKEHMQLCKGKYHEEVYGEGRVERLFEDANTLLPRLEAESFDIIVNDLPDPEESMIAATGLYSAKFFADMYRVLAPGGVVVTHAGPCAPNKMGVRQFLEEGLSGAGFTSPTVLGLVPIPSFQSEWGYLFACKGDVDLKKAVQMGSSFFEKTTDLLPKDISIVDAVCLQRFFMIPSYYQRQHE
jgi:spermidine synthase